MRNIMTMRKNYMEEAIENCIKDRIDVYKINKITSN